MKIKIVRLLKNPYLQVFIVWAVVFSALLLSGQFQSTNSESTETMLQFVIQTVFMPGMILLFASDLGNIFEASPNILSALFTVAILVGVPTLALSIPSWLIIFAVEKIRSRKIVTKL